MQHHSLQDWLNWQESLHSQEIDLGLDRVNQVLQRLEISADFSSPVITVAGTNGKGSCVALIESMAHCSGLTVGCYTSPHLFVYNERIRINQQMASDAELCSAFAAIEQARGEISLTYFEYGTLAALYLFNQQALDLVVLEVGLGGRLDAVNAINADVALISSIGIDHTDWLGHDLGSISLEKAGVMRSGKPAVIGFFQPPQLMLEYAKEHNVPVIQLGQDYLYQGLADDAWQLKLVTDNGPRFTVLSDLMSSNTLPLPALEGGFQIQNAAAALLALSLLPENRLSFQGIINGLQQVALPGRFQKVLNTPTVYVDVAHNEQAAQSLASLLNEQRIAGKTIVVVAMLADKAVSEVLSAMLPEVDHWISAGLDVPRGMSAKNMAQNVSEAMREVEGNVKLTACETVEEACKKALDIATENDRIIVFGSFYTVASATTCLTPTA